MAEQNDTTTDLKIITININGGLMKKLNENNFQRFLQDYDVMMLQETHLGEHHEYLFDGVVKVDCHHFGLDAKSKGYLTYYSSNAKGVGIIINTEHEFTQFFYNEGNYIGVCARIRGQSYVFVSFYFHSEETDPLLDLFLDDINDKHGIHVIGGDFNVTIDPKFDIVNTNDNKHKERREMFNATWPYKDVFREKHPGLPKKTFQSKSRLDYFFMKEEDYGQVNDCQILRKRKFTDHCAVELRLKGPEDRGNEEEKNMEKKEVELENRFREMNVNN